MAIERAQKLLAAAGFGSRRACEQLILEGRVSVNGRLANTLPVLVDVESDRLTVDGKPIRPERKVYFLVHKPRGVVCTNNDPSGRKRAIDLLHHISERVYPVGRLDAESTGLLLMTNDGELAQQLAHPRHGIVKTYRAEVAGHVDEATLARIRQGVWLSEGRSGSAKATIIYRRPNSTILEITLLESRNREIRRVLAKLGHKVYRLVRIKIGELSLHKLPVGGFRPLRPEELRSLHRSAARATPPPRPTAARSAGPRPASTGRPARGRSRGRGGGDNRPGRRKSSSAWWGQ